MCHERNEHEQEMFEKFWIDKVDMVSLQAAAPNYAPHNKDLFQSFSKSFKGNKIKDKTETQIQNFRCVQPFQEWYKK